MATNQITINFTPCSPSPIDGYRVFYREVGDVSFIEYPFAFTSSPIVFEVEGPVDQPYDGYIISDCGDFFGPEVPWGTVSCSSLGGCCDPVVIDAEAETIIPDESGSGSGSVGGNFLRLVFNVNMAGESLSDWNTFFGLLYFDQVIYSAGGTIVDLYNGENVIIPAAAFNGDASIVAVYDFAECVIELGDTAFRLTPSLIEVDLPACEIIGLTCFFFADALTDLNIPLVTNIPTQGLASTTSLITLTCPDIVTVGVDGFNSSGLSSINFPNCITIDDGGLRGMENLVSLSLPSLTTLGNDALSFADNLSVINLPSLVSCGLRAFRSNPTLTNITDITLPVCSDLGGTTGDDDVFLGITLQTITLTILTATATDGDVVYLQANNSVTLILV